MLVAKKLTYPVMCLFPFFVAVCEYNLPKLQMDGQPDVILHRMSHYKSPLEVFSPVVYTI